MQIYSCTNLCFRNNFKNKNCTKSFSKHSLPNNSYENKLNNINIISSFLNEWINKHNISAKTMLMYKSSVNEIQKNDKDTYNFLRKTKAQIAETSFVMYNHSNKKASPFIKQRVVLLNKEFQMQGFFDVFYSASGKIVDAMFDLFNK